MEKIIFYYPSKTIGGAQLLFIRLADYISRETEYEVYYVDFFNGFSKIFLKNSKIKYIDFEENQKTIIPNYSCVIIPANFIFGVEKRFADNKNIVFLIWSIHPHNIKPNFINLRNRTLLSIKNRKHFGGLLVSLYNKGFFYFMDYANYITNADFFRFSIPGIKYLQIPIGTGLLPEYVNRDEGIKKEYLNIAWLGRLDSDKINSVKVIFNELESSEYKHRIVFFIIGVGTDLEDLLNLIELYSFKIEIVGQLFGEELDDFITKNIDIGVAMGTSALEIAKRAKPVIMIDVCDKVYKSHKLKYDFLYQIEAYSLGSIYPFINNEKRHHYFNDALNLIVNNYDFYAEKSYQYVKNNHTIEIVANKLLTNIQTIDWEDSNFLYEKLNEINNILLSHENSYQIKLLNTIKKIRH